MSIQRRICPGLSVSSCWWQWEGLTHSCTSTNVGLVWERASCSFFFLFSSHSRRGELPRMFAELEASSFSDMASHLDSALEAEAIVNNVHPRRKGSKVTLYRAHHLPILYKAHCIAHRHCPLHCSSHYYNKHASCKTSTEEEHTLCRRLQRRSRLSWPTHAPSVAIQLQGVGAHHIWGDHGAAPQQAPRHVRQQPQRSRGEAETGH